MLKAIFIISSLAFIAIFYTVKLIQDKQFRRLAREAVGILENLQGKGLERKVAYRTLDAKYRRALNKCKRLNLKY